jgi:hypothetical protein
MASGILTNIDELKSVLELYQNVVKKSAPEAVRNVMADVAFQAAANTQFVPKQKIRSYLSNLPIKNDAGQKRYGNTQYVGQYKLINWLRKLNGLQPAGNSKFRKVKSFSISGPSAMTKTIRKRNIPRNTGPSAGINRFMDGKYKAFLQMRSNSSKFLRIGWAIAADFYGKPFNRGDFGTAVLARLSGEGYGGGSIKQLNPDLAEFSIFNGAGKFDVRGKSPVVRSSSDQQRASAIIEQGLKKAVDSVLYHPKSGIVPYLQDRYERVQKALKVMGRLK